MDELLQQLDNCDLAIDNAAVIAKKYGKAILLGIGTLEQICKLAEDSEAKEMAKAGKQELVRICRRLIKGKED